MEFIQLEWPTQLDELFTDKFDKSGSTSGWSGPMLNEWATNDSTPRKRSWKHKGYPKRSEGESTFLLCSYSQMSLDCTGG